MLLRDFLAEFGQHLSSVIPLLLSLAEGRGGSRIGSDDGRRRDKPMPYDEGGVSAVDRFRAVQCLMGLTALPYSRLHPFKTQVGGWVHGCVCEWVVSGWVGGWVGR